MTARAKLTILSVAYPLAPVGGDSAGGAEQIAASLDRLLVAAGHRSLVVACEGSAVAGTLLAIPCPTGEIDEAARCAAEAATRARIAEALRRMKIDVVHFHGLDAAAYLPLSGVPGLVTLHLPPSWYPGCLFDLAGPDLALVAVSATQRAACPSGRVRWLVPNGVPVERLAAPYAKRDFALALGRICPEKGFHLALDAAHAAGWNLILAGALYPYPEHRAYFRDAILPRLDRRRRYLGPVGFRAKRRLLSQARCLLVPSLVPETSSLVAMEALACGTPVIAFAAGALPELIETGFTGVLVRNADELAAALPAVDRIASESCRRVARARCAEQAMARRYFGLYRCLASNRRVVSRRLASGPLRQAGWGRGS